MNYLILGGGIAGTTAAEELRKLDPSASITLVSEEFHPLYSRVLLLPYLVGKVPRERIFLKKESWYEEQNIEWLPGVIAKRIDPKNNHVELSDGRELPYNKLLIATGKEVRTLPRDLNGVMYLRTLDDAEVIRETMARPLPLSKGETEGVMERGRRAMVYGGGFIGCEFLSLFAHQKIPTTHVFREPHLWHPILDAESGEVITRHLKNNKVEVIPNIASLEPIGEDSLEEVIVDGRSYPFSHLGVGIGVETDAQWLKEAGIEVEKGVKTNEYLETSVSGIFAAGDIAEFQDIVTGRCQCFGTWQNAMMQGRCAAQNMAGKKTEYQLVSSYSAEVLGLQVIFLGDADRKFAENIEVSGSAKEGSVAQYFYRKNRLVGATLVNRSVERGELWKKIAG